MLIGDVILILIPCGLGLVQSSTIVCDVCEVDPLPDFRDKRIIGSVLWTKTDMASRAECAARCFLFRPIKSFGYKDTSKECVAYTVPLTTPAAMTYSTELGFNMYSTCAPVDGGVSAWGQWTGPACPQTCGPSHTILKTRTRTCTNPAPDKGGANCTESLSETGDINCGLSECPIDGGVTAWGSWGTLVCSLTCGTAATGTRTRTRTCTNPAPAHGGADCSEALTCTTSENCGFSPCPVNGGVSSWSSWSGSCTQTCGTSHTVPKTRTRTCANPAPAHGGSDCTETLSETSVFNCGLPACTVDGGVSAWGQWTGPACSQTCGPSHTILKTRTRTCTNPAPDKGGANCTESLAETVDINCGLPECPIDGGVSAWGEWTVPVCSQTCGPSHIIMKTRTRTCTNPAPDKGGANCTESLFETGNFSCGPYECPRIEPHFGTCSSSCPGTGVVCYNEQCVCDNMYVKLGSMCVQDCGSAGYGSGFTIFQDKVLDGYNDRIVYSVPTAEACMGLCLSETDFTCAAADYGLRPKQCNLSQTPLYNTSSGSSTSSKVYDQLIRNCA
ncbi:coadhesin-like [Haliotis asinina]|uniref:coadhesin-like n=1 Tax=Haliotis asinina TaxID=109174 RepID=UPI00353218D5